MTRRRSSALSHLGAEDALYDPSQHQQSSNKFKTSKQKRNMVVFREQDFELKVVKDVQEIFRGVLSDEIIDSVLESCNYDADKATTLLFELAAEKQSSSRNPPANISPQNTCSSPGEDTHTHMGPCFWDVIPVECKLQVAVLPPTLQSCFIFCPNVWLVAQERLMYLTLNLRRTCMWRAGLGVLVPQGHGESSRDLQRLC